MESISFVTKYDWNTYIKPFLIEKYSCLKIEPEEWDLIPLFSKEIFNEVDDQVLKKMSLTEKIDMLPDDAQFILPKLFWLAIYEQAKHHLVLQKFFTFPKILSTHSVDLSIKIEIKPRDYQIEGFNYMINKYKQCGCIFGIFKANPAYGKTVFALYMVQQLKLRTLIVVHNSTLYDQWIEAIKTFMNYTDDQIGKIQGSKDFENELTKDICVVKVQSVLSQLKRLRHNDLIELYSAFSLVFVDEAHILSAAIEFAKCSFIFQTPNVIALTATPYRKAIHDFLLNATVGPTIYESSYTNFNPECHFVYTDVGMNQYESKLIKKMKFLDYNLKLPTYDAALYNYNNFYQAIAYIAAQYYKQGKSVGIILQLNKAIDKTVAFLRDYGVSPVTFYSDNDTNIYKVYTTIAFQNNIDIDSLFYKEYDLDNHIDKKKYINNLLEALKNYDVKCIFAKGERVVEKIKLLEEQIRLLGLNPQDFRREPVLTLSKRISILHDEFIQRNIDIPKFGIDAISDNDPDVVVGNFKTLTTGTNIPKLSVFILGSILQGRVSVTQIAGRILRAHENKQQPKIIYMLDAFYLDHIAPNARNTIHNNLLKEYAIVNAYDYEINDYFSLLDNFNL